VSITSRPDDLSWRTLPPTAQFFVAVVIAVGAFVLVAFFPLTYPRPWLYAALLVSACLTSVWKVNLPISLASGSTLSVSHAAELMSLVLLGPRYAMLVAVAAAWTQCTLHVRRRYPLYRTVFSAATQAVTIVVTALAYDWLDGPLAPTDFSALPKPLVGAMATYFFVNTLLIQVTTLLTMKPAMVFFDWARVPAVREMVSQLPLLIQIPAVLLVADFTQYWIHRAFHAIPFLWRVHAIHHSTESMDWLAGSRLHLLDAVVTRGLTYIPILHPRLF